MLPRHTICPHLLICPQRRGPGAEGGSVALAPGEAWSELLLAPGAHDWLVGLLGQLRAAYGPAGTWVRFLAIVLLRPNRHVRLCMPASWNLASIASSMQQELHDFPCATGATWQSAGGHATCAATGGGVCGDGMQGLAVSTVLAYG